MTDKEERELSKIECTLIICTTILAASIITILLFRESYTYSFTIVIVVLSTIMSMIDISILCIEWILVSYTMLPLNRKYFDTPLKVAVYYMYNWKWLILILYMSVLYTMIIQLSNLIA